MKKKIAALLAISGVVLVSTALSTPVLASDSSPLTPPSAVTSRMRDVRVVEDGVTRLYQTTTTNVADFLQEHGYILEQGDQINMELSARFVDSHIPRIVINRGFEVTAVVNGIPQAVRVHHDARVGHVVMHIETEHGEVYFHDLRRPDPVEPGQIIEFFSVVNHTFTATEPIPYEVTHSYDPTLNIGEEQVIQEGEVGEVETISEVITLAGLKINSRLLSETTLTDPIDQIIAVGTRNPAAQSRVDFPFVIPTADSGLERVRTITMNSSAYTSGFLCTGKRPGDPGYGITASGMRVERGVVAVDPSIIPLGTRLYIEGYGFALAADTGSAIRGYRIDLFMYTGQEALNWGRRSVTVHILG